MGTYESETFGLFFLSLHFHDFFFKNAEIFPVKSHFIVLGKDIGLYSVEFIGFKKPEARYKKAWPDPKPERVRPGPPEVR